MDRKSLLPLAGIAVGACLMLMLTVVIGLFAYNTLVGNAQLVNAQTNPGTDKGPSWTITPVNWGDANRQYLVVIAESDRDYVVLGKRNATPRPRVKNMAVYRLNPQSDHVAIEYVGARTIEYDMMLPTPAKVSQNDHERKWQPSDVFDFVKKFEERSEKDKGKDKDK